ncbi:MAG: alpha/beta hydrolase [Lactobacillus sp.]|nr:alpha/beta hydrolase [Lactobacillus sp.]
MKKWIWGSLGVILIGAVILQVLLLWGTSEQPLRTDNLHSNLEYSDVPTLLIPGWGGNAWTYRKLITSYQKQNVAQKTMTIHVTPTGKVKVKGTVAKKKNALIQLIFDWNYTKDYQPQTVWLISVLKVLHDKYHVTRLNIVAHSWGGSAFVHAMANSKSLQREISFPKVILLGTPVDEGVDESVSYTKKKKKKTTDQNYEQLIKKFQKFSPASTITFYNLMGSIDGEQTDGSVPNVQSMFLKNLLHSDWARYYQAVYANTDHTALHQRKKILENIMQILWSKRALVQK